MTVYYIPCADFANLGIAIKKIEFLKETKIDSYIYGTSEIIWTYGEYLIENKSPNFFRKQKLKNTIEEAIDELYLQVDHLMVILENRKIETIANVKIAEEILEEEKKTAKASAREHKIASNIFKNLDILKHLERKGIV